ncbi:MAG: serpin family protein, partial [Bacteroidales bacterium]
MKSLMHVLIVAVLAGPVTLSCSKWNDPKEREDIVLTKVQQDILENGNVFAIDLFREMSRELGGKNLFISPLSASLALSAVTNGASG